MRVVTAVLARDLHPGDVWHEHDWSLHVGAVDVIGASVAFAVAEFPGALMHRAADAVLDVEVASMTAPAAVTAHVKEAGS